MSELGALFRRAQHIYITAVRRVQLGKTVPTGAIWIGFDTADLLSETLIQMRIIIIIIKQLKWSVTIG
jgi:hypothetical protein